MIIYLSRYQTLLDAKRDKNEGIHLIDHVHENAQDDQEHITSGADWNRGIGSGVIMVASRVVTAFKSAMR
jgi:hypothetical protein